MGKTILTSKQLNFLELAQIQTSITKRFYLTGGTALSAFYLKHRLSEDIDLFSEQEINVPVVEAFLQSISHKLKIAKFLKEQFLGLYSYKFLYKDGDSLKVDFNYYPFPKIEKGTFFKKLEVSSLYDIAVNKIHTLGSRVRTRDYIDLYFIFKNTEYKPEKYLHRMRIDSQAKFDWPLEPKHLLAAFLKVQDLTERKDWPKMLIPFDQKNMEDFFLRLAKSLEKEIFE
ncbi:nucleotidyl transferase AbiEii/AbiGii toxin family protein [Candidatus Roizmanbacteria bacterium]|nr:nucleotidyl transferase AbiEii/AbiGii toxin family protein [Candidatus Roizmanbacteria bacterium]